MTDVPQSDTSERRDQPGKTRTWWHPFLVRMLACTLESAFKVEQEVSVGKVPLRVDILLIRRGRATLRSQSERSIRIGAAIESFYADRIQEPVR